MPDEIVTVELDESAADEIATKTAEKVAAAKADGELQELRDELKALREEMHAKPARSELDEEGVKAKPSESPVAYGGGDMYTHTGETDAERATGLYLAQVMLASANRRLSPRAKHVMLTAAEAALKSAPEPISATKGLSHDRDAFVRKTYGEYREEAYKAMTSTGANAGDEWVPTFATSELWRDVHLDTVVEAQFRRVEMPTNPYTLPTLDDDITFRFASSENTAVTAADLNTGNATLTANKIQAEINFSGEVTEDSIIPIVPEIRANFVRRGAQTIDDLVVHGDSETAATGNVNSDDAAPTAGSFYLATNNNGLRKFAVVTNTGQTSNVAAALTSANFTTIQALMGRYGARSSDLRIITGPSTWLAMRTIAEVITVDKYGPNATVVRGELARFFNIPILLSEAIPGTTTDKVDADGKYTTTSPSTNDTKGWLILVNTLGWRIGYRRELTIESFRDIQKDQNILVASFRRGQIPSGISVLHTASGRNITV